MKSSVPELIERLYNATGPDQALDALIFRAIDAPLPTAILNTPINLEWDETHQCYFAEMGGGLRAKYTQPAYTASIDAAVSLVPEGWCWRYDSSTFDAEVSDFSGRFLIDADKECHGAHKNPAIAITIAALRARVS